MKINGQEVRLVPYGAQKKGRSEEGFIILRKVKRPFGGDIDIAVMDPTVSHASPGKEWIGKIGILWGTVSNSAVTPMTVLNGATREIPIPTLWVKGIYYAGGLWRIESFPVDDEFSANRLSVEIVPDPWWKRLINFLTHAHE